MYMKRTIKYGNRIEVRKYHTFRCPGKGERARGERKQPTKEQMAAALEKCGLSATVRGEALTLAQFAELANVLSEDTGK